MTGRPAIDLDRVGPADERWDRVVAGLPTWPATQAAPRRLVVVAPHPDDESLGIGGLIATLARRLPVTLVCVTDGEAAPGRWSPDELARRRRAELTAAAGVLAPAGSIVRLGLPDGGLDHTCGRLEDMLDAVVQPDDLVVSTLDRDGHPDHDAVGRATRDVATARAAEHFWFPVWAWHWHDPDASVLRHGRRVELDPAARCAKAAAVACHRSQVDGAAPVVPPSHVQRCLRRFEVLVPS